jgi:predicted unusual protein kinase regulating ubiquinone biosynthesis (AarF/ABC1/UbiB family)
MFIKLGQVLSTRSDLLPEAYRTELAKLQDDVAPLPANIIAHIIREDLEASPDQIFGFFGRDRRLHERPALAPGVTRSSSSCANVSCIPLSMPAMAPSRASFEG